MVMNITTAILVNMVMVVMLLLAAVIVLMHTHMTQQYAPSPCMFINLSFCKS